MGIALHPQFTTNPAKAWVYLLYTYSRDNQRDCPDLQCPANARLSRFLTKLDNGMTSAVGGEQVLLEGYWCQEFPAHMIGTIVFGEKDGALYMGSGDGSSWFSLDYGASAANAALRNPCNDPPGGPSITLPSAEGGALRAQDIRTPDDPLTYDGCILRIDPDTGRGLPDNPFYNANNPNAAENRVAAYGSRNPFRMTVKPGTNDIYMADVGWGDYEEINRLQDVAQTRVGPNYGWPCYEGPLPQGQWKSAGAALCESLYKNPTNVQEPYISWKHGVAPQPSGCSSAFSGCVTGVEFYRGGSYPSQYTNALFFSDFTMKCTWVALPDAQGNPSKGNFITLIDDMDVVDIATGPGNDLYIVAWGTGNIYSLSYVSSVPNAAFTPSKTYGVAPLSVSFDASGSRPGSSGGSISYSWDLNGDGTYGDSASVKPTYTYTTAGTYNVNLRVSGTGGSDTASTKVTVVSNSGQLPNPKITSPAGTLKWSVGDRVNFAGSGSKAANQIVWNIVMQHCPVPNSCHSHSVLRLNNAQSGSFQCPEHEMRTWIRIQLIETDPATGLSATATVDIYPFTINVNMVSVPPGIPLVFADKNLVTPYTVLAIEKGSSTIAAPATRVLPDGSVWKFDRWSDGQGATHVVGIPTSDVTFTAYYTKSSGQRVTGIDCGNSQAVTDGAGLVWAADTGFVGGVPTDTANAISGAAAGRSRVYQTQRFGGAFSYVIPLQAGKYTVILHFAETYWTGPNLRKFNVNIQGVRVLSNFDIYAAAGAMNKVVTRAFVANVASTGNRQLKIDFAGAVDNAQVAAIELYEATTSTPSPTPSPSPPASKYYLKPIAFIACGSAADRPINNVVYKKDFGFIGGQAADHPEVAIVYKNAAWARLLQGQRYGTFAYELPAASGAAYKIFLWYAETYWTAAGQRLFNVNVNGVRFRTNYDVVKAAGGARKGVVDSARFRISTDKLRIDFISVVDNAMVSGIAVYRVIYY
eukprot:jgi/Chlat1/2326/Chrsp17S08732